MGSEAGQDNASVSTDIDQLRARDEAIRDQYEFTQQSPNFIDDFSGAEAGSLPTISVQPTLTADEIASARMDRSGSDDSQRFFASANVPDPSDFNFAGSQAAQDLRTGAEGVLGSRLGGMIPGGFIINALTGLPSQLTLDALNRGAVPTFEDGMITGTTGQGFGANQTMGTIGQMNQPGVEGGLNTPPVVPVTESFFQDDGGGDNNNENMFRRRTTAKMDTPPVTPPVSDDLALNVLQNPFFLYSGRGNLFQPYGYAPNTLVDLLGTRNLTQPSSAAPNLNLFGNPRDFL